METTFSPIFLKILLDVIATLKGSKLGSFQDRFREPNCIFIEVVCISNGTSLGCLQKFEEGAGEFKRPLVPRLS